VLVTSKVLGELFLGHRAADVFQNHIPDVDVFFHDESPAFATRFHDPDRSELPVSDTAIPAEHVAGTGFGTLFLTAPQETGIVQTEAAAWRVERCRRTRRGVFLTRLLGFQKVNGEFTAAGFDALGPWSRGQGLVRVVAVLVFAETPFDAGEDVEIGVGGYRIGKSRRVGRRLRIRNSSRTSIRTSYFRRQSHSNITRR
jgi:hypothetical protein